MNFKHPRVAFTFNASVQNFFKKWLNIFKWSICGPASNIEVIWKLCISFSMFFFHWQIGFVDQWLEHRYNIANKLETDYCVNLWSGCCFLLIYDVLPVTIGKTMSVHYRRTISGAIYSKTKNQWRCIVRQRRATTVENRDAAHYGIRLPQKTIKLWNADTRTPRSQA